MLELRPSALSSARRDVAVKRAPCPDEDDAVASGIALVPFHFGIGHRNAGPVRDYAFAIRDDGDIVIAVDLEIIGLEGVGFTAARERRIVRLHEVLEPLSDVRGGVAPLTIVARRSGRTQRQHEKDDRQPHYGSSVQRNRSSRLYRHATRAAPSSGNRVRQCARDSSLFFHKSIRARTCVWLFEHSWTAAG